MHREEELVRKSKNGDIDAFEELVCRYERRVYTVAYRMMGNHEDASDLAQEAFLRAFQGIEKFRGEASFLTWVCRIVTNVCRDELRKKHHVFIESYDERIDLDEGEVTKQYPTSDPGPAEVYEKKELQDYVQAAISTLSPEFRIALVMRDIQGFSYQEIAKELECSLGTVKSRINRARNYLKEKLISEQEQKANSQRLFV